MAIRYEVTENPDGSATVSRISNNGGVFEHAFSVGVSATHRNAVGSALIDPALLARDDARIARLEDVVRDLRHAAIQVVEFDEGEDGSDLEASHLFSIRIETLADCIDVLDALDDADAPGWG